VTKTLQALSFALFLTSWKSGVGATTTQTTPMPAPAVACEGVNVVRGGSDCLYFETYSSTSVSERPTLLVVLRGDAPFNPPDYHYRWARVVSQMNADVIAIAMLRPGYADPAGHASTGNRGESIGDNYTPAVVDAIADATTALRARFHPARVIMAGHSGGAAISADIMGRRPGTADAALIVSCPCDVTKWRQHMRTMQGSTRPTQGSIWDTPVNAVSPVDVVNGVDVSARLSVMVGDHDDVAPPDLSREYRDRVLARGLSVVYAEVPNGGHEIFETSKVYLAASALVNAIR